LELALRDFGGNGEGVSLFGLGLIFVKVEIVGLVTLKSLRKYIGQFLVIEINRS